MAQQFMRCLLLAALASSLPLASCGGKALPATQNDRATVSLVCEVTNAEVWVDGRYFREVGKSTSTFRLRAGDHRIEIRHDDYHSMYYELSIVAGTRQTLKVELARKLP